MDLFMQEQMEKVITLMGEIKLKIKITLTNEDAYQSTDFEADLYLITDECEYMHKSFTTNDDFAGYMVAESESDNEQLKKVEAVLSEIDLFIEEFNNEATSSYRQEQYDEEAKRDLDDLNREYWASR